MSTAVEDDVLRQNSVRIKGASAERMIERPLLTWVELYRELTSFVVDHPSDAQPRIQLLECRRRAG
jgi:hypothetical protein